MRSEADIYKLIDDFSQDSRIRAVLLNGSRANPEVTADPFQDYDFAFVVDALETFIEDSSWLERFGPRLIMQIPESMRHPANDGHYGWMFILEDNVRLDMQFFPISMIPSVRSDSLLRVLIDKDDHFTNLPPSSDQAYWVEAPTTLDYFSCCNNFYWCLQNVAKAIVRKEISQALIMYESVVKPELYEMLNWFIGTQHNFRISTGKMGKYYEKHLSDSLYKMYLQTYARADGLELWEAMESAIELFEILAITVGNSMGYPFNHHDKVGILKHLTWLKTFL